MDKASINILEFAHAKVLNEVGEKIQLSTLWKKQTIMFIFLRHFGCVACRAHAVQIWSERAKFEAGGSKIVFVSNGTPHFIRVFKEDLGLGDAPVYTDPTLESFKAAGFRRGFLASLGPRSLLKGLSLMAQGHTNSKLDSQTGDYWQLGGVVVINPDGRVKYHYISQILGDYPPDDDVIESASSTN